MTEQQVLQYVNKLNVTGLCRWVGIARRENWKDGTQRQRMAATALEQRFVNESGSYARTNWSAWQVR